MRPQVPVAIRANVRNFCVWTALTVGAWPFLALDYYRPLQFEVVLKEAVFRVWPFGLAVALATLATSLSYWILWAGDGLSRWRALLAAALPLALLASAVSVASVTAGVIAYAAVGVALLCLLSWWFLRRRPAGSPTPLFASPWAGALAAALLYGLLTVAAVYDPIWFPRRIGSLVIITAFIGFGAVLFAFCSQRPRAAAAGLAYLFVAVFFLPANDHHIPNTTPNNNVRPLDEAFLDWAKNRKDLGEFRKAQLPYPVIFVSSEAAGSMPPPTLMVRSPSCRRTARLFCNTFSPWSACPGGPSATRFWRAKRRSSKRPPRGAVRRPPPRQYRRRRRRSPWIISPRCWAACCSSSLSTALRRYAGLSVIGAILAELFLSVAGNKAFLQTAEGDSFDTAGARPAVVSVATNVADGRRFVISPFAPEAYDGGTAQWWPGVDDFPDEAKRKRDVSVIDAAGVSARFPWVTPTGFVTGGGR